jgi:ribosome-associated protein
MNPKCLTDHIKEILEEKKGIDIQVIHVEGKTILADYFILATGTSSTHVRALSEEIQYHLKEKFDISPDHVEGYESKRWILLDYKDVIVHLFQNNDRDFYSLEKLWENKEKF